MLEGFTVEVGMSVFDGTGVDVIVGVSVEVDV